MTVVIKSGSTLNIGSGAIMQGGSVANAPSYVLFNNTSGVIARYDGLGNSTPLWTNTMTTTARALGFDSVNQKIYAADDGGNVRKMDLDGATEWTVNITSDQIHGPTIAVDENGDIYVATRTGAAQPTRKLRASDGAVLWSSSTSYTNGQTTIYSQAENAVYVCHQAGHAAGLVKYNASTGAELWNKNSSDVLVSSVGAPASPTDGVLLPDGNIALTTTGWTGSQNRGHYFVLNASTGAQVVKTSFSTTHIAGTIAVDATHTFISTGGGGDMYAWTHAGGYVDQTSGLGGGRPMGTRASTSQVYVANNASTNVEELSVSGSSIATGASIGPDGQNFGQTKIIFID